MSKIIYSNLIDSIKKNFNDLIDNSEKKDYNGFFSFRILNAGYRDVIKANFNAICEKSLKMKDDDELFEILSSFKCLKRTLVPIDDQSYMPVVQLLPVDDSIYTTVALFLYNEYKEHKMKKIFKCSDSNIEIILKSYDEKHINFTVFKVTDDNVSSTQSYLEFFNNIQTYNHIYINKIRRKINIINFYHGIYQHRLENILGELVNREGKINYETKLYTDLLMKLLGVISQNQSYSIPIGTKASEKLSEIFLNDYDEMIIEWAKTNANSKMIVFRWSDNYCIYSENERDIKGLVKKIAESLINSQYLKIDSKHICDIGKIVDLQTKITECVNQKSLDETMLELLVENYIEKARRKDIIVVLNKIKGLENIYKFLKQLYKFKDHNQTISKTIASFLMKNNNNANISARSNEDAANELFGYFIKDCNDPYEDYICFELLMAFNKEDYLKNNLLKFKRNELLIGSRLIHINVDLFKNYRFDQDSRLWNQIEYLKFQYGTNNYIVPEVEMDLNVMPFIPVDISTYINHGYREIFNKFEKEFMDKMILNKNKLINKNEFGTGYNEFFMFFKTDKNNISTIKKNLKAIYTEYFKSKNLIKYNLSLMKENVKIEELLLNTNVKFRSCSIPIYPNGSQEVFQLAPFHHCLYTALCKTLHDFIIPNDMEINVSELYTKFLSEIMTRNNDAKSILQFKVNYSSISHQDLEKTIIEYLQIVIKDVRLHKHMIRIINLIKTILNKIHPNCIGLPFGIEATYTLVEVFIYSLFRQKLTDDFLYLYKDYDIYSVISKLDNSEWTNQLPDFVNKMDCMLNFKVINNIIKNIFIPANQNTDFNVDNLKPFLNSTINGEIKLKVLLRAFISKINDLKRIDADKSSKFTFCFLSFLIHKYKSNNIMRYVIRILLEFKFCRIIAIVKKISAVLLNTKPEPNNYEVYIFSLLLNELKINSDEKVQAEVNEIQRELNKSLFKDNDLIELYVLKEMSKVTFFDARFEFETANVWQQIQYLQLVSARSYFDEFKYSNIFNIRLDINVYPFTKPKKDNNKNN